MYNYIDLFSGIGGFALGAHMAGMKFKEHFASEIDPFCVELYQKRFPDSIQLGDINNIDCDELKKEYGDKWILTGGFPCQNISCAGKGEGIHGERSGLWFEYWRLIRDLRPRFAIVENVGMLVHRGLRDVLASLAEIGYNAEWQDIRAEDVGAPHRRERIWIVAYPDAAREWGIERKSKIEKDVIPNTNKQHDGNTGHGAGKIFRERSKKTEISECLADNNWERRKELNNGIAEGSKYANGCNAGRKAAHPGWAVEPDVGRLVNGVSSVLDSDIKRFYNENKYDKTTITKIDRYYRSILQRMWIKKKSTKTSCGGKSGFCYSIVSKMPYEIAYEEWYMGAWIEKNEELRNMWEKVLSATFQEAQNLLKRMSIKIRENKCNEKMAIERMNRLKGLGNAIVPKIAEILFRTIKDIL